MALQNLGVQLLPLIAGLGVAGAGIALAMQGVLSNLVAGLSIILTKPFRVGQYIQVAGVEGQVEQVSLFSTILTACRSFQGRDPEPQDCRRDPPQLWP